MEKLFVIDTETGGIDPRKFSILSFAGAVWEDGEILDTISLSISEPHESVEPEAMLINGINLDENRKNGIKPIDAIFKIERFLEKHFGNSSVTICGHNVHFDVGFLQRLYRIAGVKYSTRYSRRYVDTASVIGFLSIAGVVEIKKASLDNALEYFKISHDKSIRHTALGDVVLTCALLNKMIETTKR